MKVPRHIVDARRRQLAELISSQHYLPVPEICKRFGISEATARRDLDVLEKNGRITRTHGGAITEFNERFPSFSERQARAGASKEVLAEAVMGVIGAGRTLFLDSGTTVSYLAEAMARGCPTPLRVLTVNLPVAEKLAGVKGVEVYVTGGRMLGRQSALLGSRVVSAIEGWRFDVAFLSAEAMDEEGLWNSQLEIVAHQHAVVRRATRHIFMLDRTKAGKRAPHFLLPWAAVDSLLTDATPAQCRKLGAAASGRIWRPGMEMPFDLEAEDAPVSLPVHVL